MLNLSAMMTFISIQLGVSLHRCVFVTFYFRTVECKYSRLGDANYHAFLTFSHTIQFLYVCMLLVGVAFMSMCQVNTTLRALFIKMHTHTHTQNHTMLEVITGPCEGLGEPFLPHVLLPFINLSPLPVVLG